MKFEGKHWAILAALLGSIGVQLATLHTFGDALTPAFLGSLLLQVSSTIGAVYVKKPGQ